VSEQYVEYVEGRLYALFRKEFELCQVKPGERAVVMYDAASRPDYVQAASGALESLDAVVFTIHLPGVARGDMPSPAGIALAAVTAHPTADNGKAAVYAGNSPASSVMAGVASAVDFVVDLARLHHAPGRVEIINAGARMLTVGERPDALERMFPSEDLKRRVMAGVKLMEKAKQMRVTSQAGTDVSCDIDGTTVLYQYGFADAPARYDSWPGGFLATFPNPGSTHGRIVLDVGDLIYHFNRYVESQVALTVEHGYITKIEGGGLDAKLIRGYLESWDDRECFATSHFGWGLNERASWDALQFYDKNSTQGQDGRAVYGGFLWSTGPTPYVKRFVPGHFDIPMRNCSVLLDGEAVVVDGDVVHEKMRVPGFRTSKVPAQA
jgi:2,5-dihydroxypyridine 5,6-dioxygenase